MVQAVTGLIGGVIQSGAAKKATKAQTAAAQQQLGLEREIFDYAKEIQAPFVDAGTLANAILQYELWGGEAPVISEAGFRVGGNVFGTEEEARNALTQATDAFNRHSTVHDTKFDRMMLDEFGPQHPFTKRTGVTTTTFDPARGIAAAGFDPRNASVEAVDPVRYGGFRQTPDYQFAFDEGQRAVSSSAAARGGVKNGATLKALTEYGQNFAGLRRDNYINQLFGMQGSGQASTNALQTAGHAFASGSSNALSAIGNAQAAGAIAKGNIANGIVQNGFQGIMSLSGGGGGGIGSIASQLLGGFGGGAGGAGKVGMGFF